MLSRLIKRGSGAPAGPVVVPGPAGATVGIIPSCVACGSDRTTRVPVLLGDGSCGVACADAHGCAVRYRAGASPASYAAGLRGEILAVAP